MLAEPVVEDPLFYGTQTRRGEVLCAVSALQFFTLAISLLFQKRKAARQW